jgi:hypothetical protein
MCEIILHRIQIATRRITSKFDHGIALHVPRPDSWRYTTFVEKFVAAALEAANLASEGIAKDAVTDPDRFKSRYRYEETVCWKYDGAGVRDGPFCPNCVDDGKERRLKPGAMLAF